MSYYFNFIAENVYLCKHVFSDNLWQTGAFFCLYLTTRFGLLAWQMFILLSNDYSFFLCITSDIYNWKSGQQLIHIISQRFGYLN